MRRFAPTPARRCSCARLERRRARSRWKAPSTKWRMPAAWILWHFGSRTMPRSSRSPASRFPRRRCANVTGKAPNVSAGDAARSRRGRCATTHGLLVGWGVGTATFPAHMFAGTRQGGAAPRRHRRHGDRRARYGPGRLDCAGADRGRRPWARPRPGRLQVRHFRPAGCRHRRRLGPYRDRRDGDPQRRRRCRSPGLPSSRPTTSARRCLAPAMPA